MGKKSESRIAVFQHMFSGMMEHNPETLYEILVGLNEAVINTDEITYSSDKVCKEFFDLINSLLECDFVQENRK